MSETRPYQSITLRVGSLCTGYGGLDLALGQVEHAWHAEIDPAPAKVLSCRFPGVPNHGDIKALDHAALDPVDILTAGYPCQPFSDAGLRKGADDPRHLWPWIADTIGHLRPGLVLLENVRGHVRRGLDSVLADLAHLGYDATWGLVRASDAGAPHRRERIFIAAQDADRTASGEWRLPAPGQASSGRTWADAGGRDGALAANSEGDGWVQGRSQHARIVGRSDVALGGAQAVADSDRERLKRRPECDSSPNQPGLEAPLGRDADGCVLDWGVYGPAIRQWERITGHAAPWATEPRGRGGAQRLSPAFVEWMMGLPPGWVTDCELTANEQLKALGNGVVPQQAALAFQLLGVTPAVEVAA